jgi:hypothetical protein
MEIMNQIKTRQKFHACSIYILDVDMHKRALLDNLFWCEGYTLKVLKSNQQIEFIFILT